MKRFSDAMTAMFFPVLQRALLILLLGQSAIHAAAFEENSEAFRTSHFRAKFWTTEQGLPQNRISCLKQTRDGYLWIGTWFGLARFDGLRFTIFNKSNTPQITSDAINSLVENDDGALWIGTQDGVVSYRDHRFRHLTNRINGVAQKTRNADLGEISAQFVYQDRASNVWMNTQGGMLKRWNQKEWQEIDLGGRFSGGAVVCMEEDYEGNLWIGTENGLVQLQESKVRVFTRRDGLPHDNVWSVCETTDGMIWCFTDKGLGRIRDNRVVKFASSNSWLHGRAICSGQNGSLWTATMDHGVWQIQNDKLVQTLPQNKNHDLPLTIYEDTSGRLWSSSPRDLTIWQNGKIMSGAELTGEAIPEVDVILEDRDKTFWFGCKDIRLIHWHDGQKTIFTERDGMNNARIWAIHQDTEGVLWIGTANGLTRCDRGKFFTFHRRHGLPEPTVNWILEDDDGFLWLSGQRGVHRVNRADLRNVAEGRAKTFSAYTVGTEDGMESAETNGEHQPAGCKSRDGRLWFPTGRGLVVIDPKSPRFNETPPPIILEQIKANEKIIFGEAMPREAGLSRDETIRIPPGDGRVLEFKYAANTFVAPAQTRFRYRLTGAETNWPKPRRNAPRVTSICAPAITGLKSRRPIITAPGARNRRRLLFRSRRFSGNAGNFISSTARCF